MAHQLEFGDIHIIEWLEPTDRPTGSEIHEHIGRTLLGRNLPITVNLHVVDSVEAFLAQLRTIEREVNERMRIPLLQIETHGNDDGIGLSGGLSWPDLTQALTPLNVATRCRLPVFLSACEGMWGIRMVQGMERAPFFALMGPKPTVSETQIVRAMCAFYDKVIVQRDGLNAVARMNSVVDPDEDTFFIYNREQLFCDIWNWYLQASSTDEQIATRVDEAVRKELHKRSLSEAEVPRFRAFVRTYILNRTARFEDARRLFFMIDQFPENDSRFKLVLSSDGSNVESIS